MQTGKSHRIFWKKKLFWAHESTSEAPERKKVWRCKNVGFHIFSYIFHFWEKENFLDWAECWNYVPAKPLPSEVSVWQTHERRGNFMKSVSHREMWTGEEINQTSSPETNKNGGIIFLGANWNFIWMRFALCYRHDEQPWHLRRNLSENFINRDGRKREAPRKLPFL